MRILPAAVGMWLVQLIQAAWCEGAMSTAKAVCGSCDLQGEVATRLCREALGSLVELPCLTQFGDI